MEKDFLNSFYQTLLQGEDYYNFLLRDYINCRSFDRNQVIFQYKDRGNGYKLVWDFFISPMQAEGFKNRHSSEISYFKEWLILKTNNNFIVEFADLHKYLHSLNLDRVINVSRHNYYECYGICMILFELLNKIYISGRKETNLSPYKLLQLAFFYSMTYSRYHLNRDTLKSVDVLSNFARMHDYFGNDTIILLLDAGITNAIGVNFLYIWAMQKCYDILPIVPIKSRYHTNARMMHQNQTVGGVTADAFETSFMESCNFGQQIADSILQFYETKVDINEYLVDEDLFSEEISSISGFLIKNALSEVSINWMQFLNKTIQVEKFDGVNIVTPPYIPAPIHYTYLLKRIGLSNEQISNFEEREYSGTIPLVKYRIRVDDILGKTIEYSDRTFYKLNERGETTNASFRDMILMVDENKNLHSIVLTGNHLYPIKKDIDWTGLFYGVPCKVTLHDFRNILYEDRLIIAVFGISETFDTSLFSSYD